MINFCKKFPFTKYITWIISSITASRQFDGCRIDTRFARIHRFDWRFAQIYWTYDSCPNTHAYLHIYRQTRDKFHSGKLASCSVVSSNLNIVNLPYTPKARFFWKPYIETFWSLEILLQILVLHFLFYFDINLWSLQFLQIFVTVSAFNWVFEVFLIEKTENTYFAAWPTFEMSNLHVESERSRQRYDKCIWEFQIIKLLSI